MNTFAERRPWRRSAEGTWLRAVAAGRLPPPGRGLDEGFLLHLAQVHRLSGVAGAWLARGGDPVPGHTELVRRWRVALGEQGLVDDLLGTLGTAAAAAGLPLVALKGADLGRRLYGPGERVGNDVDLLVPAARLEDAFALFASLGFAGDHPDPAYARAHWFATTFRSAARPRLQVDLHWALGPRPRTRWDVSAVLARAEPSSIDGVRGLAAPDLLAYLALHAVAFHGAAGRWLWWLDVSRVAPLVPEDEARRRAREVGGVVALEAARLRARELFERPSEVRGATWRARAAAALGRGSEDRGGGRLRRWPVAALAIDRPRDLAGAVWSVVRRG